MYALHRLGSTQLKKKKERKKGFEFMMFTCNFFSFPFHCALLASCWKNSNSKSDIGSLLTPCNRVLVNFTTQVLIPTPLYVFLCGHSRTLYRASILEMYHGNCPLPSPLLILVIPFRKFPSALKLFSRQLLCAAGSLLDLLQ